MKENKKNNNGFRMWLNKVWQLRKKLAFFSTDKGKKILSIVLTVLVIFVTFSVLVYYICFPSRGYFHSDSTDTIMWAEAMFDAKGLYNLDFNYAAFLPFGGSLLMLPFIPIFGVSMTTHVLGMTLFYILFLLSILWLCRSLKFNWVWSVITCFILAFGVAGSDKIREIFYGHIIYYSLGTLFFIFGLGLIFRFEAKFEVWVKDKKRINYYLYLISCFLFFLLTTLNGLHSLTLFTLPVVGGYFLERFFREKTKFFSRENRHFFIILTAVVSGVVIGLGFHILLALKIPQGYADAYSSYSAPGEWWGNITRFFEHWFTLYGVDVAYGDPIKSLDSIMNLFRIVSGFILLIIPVVALAKYAKINDYKIRVLLISHFILMILLMIGYIFGFLASASWRLSPLLASSILLSVIYLKTLIDSVDKRRLACVFLAPIMITSSITMVLIAKMPSDYNLEYGMNDGYFIARELEDLGLEYGYADFWHANAITVISNSSVKVRSVTDELEIYHYQSQLSWYLEQEGIDTYFILLTNAQYNLARTKAWYDLEHTEVTIIGSRTYYILIFPENIF